MNSPAIYYICLLYMSSASPVSSPVAAVSETAGFRFRRGHHENFRAGSFVAACLRQALTTPILLVVTIWAASHLNPALSDEGSYKSPYLSGVQVFVFDRHVPMGVEDFEAVLLFALVGVLVRKELLEQRGGIEVVVSNLGVLEKDGRAIVPPAVLGGVVAGGDREYFQDAAQLHLFLQ